jgi:CHAD domain-containing protein
MLHTSYSVEQPYAQGNPSGTSVCTASRGLSKDLKKVGEGDVDAVHRARVASRRLRELLPLLGLPRDQTKGLERRLRKTTKQLGKVRELDVQIALIKELRDGRYCSPTALAQLRITAIRARLGGLDARVARRAARVRSSIDAVGALYAPERPHDVRLAVKKLRYASELVAEVTPWRLDTDIATLKGAQDLLGRLHDLEMLLARAREVQASFPLSDLVKWRSLDSVVSFLEQECRRLHARYMRERIGLIAVTSRLVSGVSESEPVAERAVS